MAEMHPDGPRPPDSGARSVSRTESYQHHHAPPVNPLQTLRVPEPKDRLRDTTPNLVHDISHEELLSVRTWSDLVKTYHNAGLNFKSDAELYQQVCTDWKRESRKLILAAHALTEVGKLFEKQLTIEGTEFRLVGVVHALELALKTDFRYHKEILDSVSKQPFWLVEHNLTSGFIPIRSPEIPDHNVDGSLYRIASGIWDMYHSLWRASVLHLRLLRINHVKTKETPPMEGESNADEKTFRPKTRGDFLVSLTNIHPDALAPVPEKIDLLWREKANLGYTRSQRRSAYQAIVLKGWDPVRSYHLTDEMKKELPPEVLKQKGLVAGAAHIVAVQHFLENGVADQRVIKRAEAVVRHLNQGMESYNRYRTKLELAHFAGNAFGGAAMGFGMFKLFGWIASLW